MKKILLIILAIIILVALAGIYKFNFTTEDYIPVQLYNGMPTEELNKILEDTPVEKVGVAEISEASSRTVAYHGDVEGYLVEPQGKGPFPGVVLIHEWWGLNQNIKDLADDFAAQGYVALAVDLYGGKLAETPDEARELAGSVRQDTDAAFNNLSDATDYLSNLSSVDQSRLASVGWCFGGQWAYNMAANNMGIDASVMYYGRFSLEDDLSMMRADILGHFGEEDASIAVDDVTQFEAKLNTLEGDHAVFIYPNAGHAFANEDNEDAYNEEAAQLAWKRTMDFLSRELNNTEN